MKKFRTLLIVIATVLPLVAMNINGYAASAAAAATPTPVVASPTSANPGQLADGDIPALTDGQPIHMPDLLGQSLEYATGIWDSADETPPQIRVVGPTNDLSLVVVKQQPAAGTLIFPSQATIVLTMGKGPVQHAKPSPTPAPPTTSLNVAAGQATLLRSPYVQNLTTNSVTIVWTTKEDGASEVHYGLSDYGSIASATSTYFTTPAAAPYNYYYVHQATLNGLSTDTVYQYKIFTNSVDLTPGSLVTFRTAKPSTTSSFRFAVYGDSGDGSQNQKDVATRLQQVQPDLVLHTGDLIYPEASYDLFETNFFQIYKNLDKSVWIAPSMGNHDVTYNNGKSFTDVFVNPPNATKASEQELYYSFDYGNAHFTVLNNYFSMTTVGSAQYNWMVNDLANTNQFWKFVVFHEPPYTTDTNQLPKDNSAIVSKLVPLFEKYNVDIVFNGHYHYYERMYPLLGGKVSTIDNGGVVYVVTGGGGSGLNSIGSGTLNSRDAAKVKKFHLTMIDITGCSLQLSAVQKVSGSTDTFDPSDIFDTYSINRCNSSTPTATNTPAPTFTPTNTPTLAPSSTPTNTSTPALTSTPTNTPTAGPTPTNTPTPTDTLVPTSTPTATNTSIPTNTPTATDTSTPGPTSTPTATFTPSPTSAVSDVIFKDGFESGNMSAWSSNATGTGGLTVSPAAALVGSYGLQAQLNGSTMYVNDASPNAEPHYRARFYFDPNSVSMTSGDYMYILQGYTGTGTASILRIELKNSSGVYQLRARAMDNSSTWKNTAYVTISDAPHVLEVEWGAASGTGLSDGYLNFWVDGAPQGSVTGIANDTHRMETVRLGVPYTAAVTATGAMYFDAFESRRQTYIGP